ncbi:tetratricopeptide repeat protein [Streptomyces sp. NPDC048392]|uniref:tetratricopeptide repeat protein n=1 Tax=Streptomyces sp. NPDC048392 TaxID=3365543 RepID=UPI003718D1E7
MSIDDERLAEAGRALDRGDFRDAADLYEAAVLAASLRLGEDHDAVLQGELEWGLALYGLGRYAEAEIHQRRSLEVRIRTLGAGHEDTLNTQGRLAESIGEQGRWQECEELAEQAIALVSRDSV